MITTHECRYHKDLSLHELTTAESLLLISYRLWLLHHTQGPAAQYLPDWRTGLASVGLALAADKLFEPLAETTLTGARRPVEIPALRCRRISQQESFLLGCHAQLQHHLLEDAGRTLAHWLTPTAGRAASPLLWRFAMALNTVQLVLPLRYGPRPTASFTAAPSPLSATGSRRLH